MRKIAIILPSNLPVPAVRGGAVELLIEKLVRQNEKTPKYEFTVFSAYNETAEKLTECFRYTKFIYVKVIPKIDDIHFLVYRVFKKIFNIAIPERISRNKMIKKIDHNDYDYILFQAGELYSLKVFNKYLPANKVLVHAHGQITPIPAVDKYFSYYLPISDFVGNWWANKSNRPKDTYLTWKNCIDIEQFKQNVSETEKSNIRKKIGVNENDFVVIFVGRLIPEKGVKELLNALEYVKSKNIKMLILGSSKFADKSMTVYERTILKQTQKFADKVVFTGYIPNEELYKYYSVANISCVPSIWNEPAGLVVLEAMAAGKPVITTGTGGIKEYIDTETAIFVNIGEQLSQEIAYAIDDLNNDYKKRIKMSIKAKSMAESYSIEVYLTEFEKIIKSISMNKQ